MAQRKTNSRRRKVRSGETEQRSAKQKRSGNTSSRQGYNTSRNNNEDLYEPEFGDDDAWDRKWEEKRRVRGSEDNELNFYRRIDQNLNEKEYRNEGRNRSQYFKGRDWDIEGEFEERDEQFPARTSQGNNNRIYETDFENDNDYERAFRNRNRSRVFNNVDNDGDYGYGHRDGFDSVYNAINENSYQGYERGQEEFSGDERRMDARWRSRKDSKKHPSKNKKRK